ncbi:MAG: non-homologous end-joining DNA ligase [Deltaproteobacteria bacterium]|nr:non-homologous end-joining DNA ligase [Deltaproteobacteria bacterium]
MSTPDVFALSRRYRLAPLVVGDATRLADVDTKWSFELAWDGHRVLAACAGGRARIVSSDLREWGDAFPGIALALRKLAARDAVIEGFLCALDDRGRPSFELLREKARTRSAALFAVWDLLHADGEDLRARPLAERRVRLAEIVAPCGAAIALSEPIDGDVAKVLAATREHGVPGVFARPSDGPYPAFDDAPWLAIAPEGETPPAWGRSLSPPPVVTNEKKVLFPRDGFTKKEIVAYYEDVAPVLLPLLRDRPVVLQRWPDGIDEFTWYQHRLPPRAPDYLRGVWIEGNHRILLANRDSLLWMVNQAAITLHGWASRVKTLEHADWVTLDLDPGPATTWADVIEVAIAVRKLLELLELPSVPKTSGQRGLHVMIPIAPGSPPGEVKDFARLAAQLVARLLPEKVTLETDTEKRRGRLFLDHLQGYVGKSLVLAYSLRAVDGAPASVPLEWSEIDASLDPKKLTMKTMRARLDAKGDLAAPLVSGEGPSLTAAVAKLAAGGR